MNWIQKSMRFYALGFGSGKLPYFAGTWGTLAAIPIYLILTKLSPTIYFSVSIVLTVLAIYACGLTAKNLGMHDHPSIVADEIVGFLWVMCFVPKTAIAIIIAFLIFRLVDALKPWPICWIDKHVKGGFGIVLDDLVASVVAWVLVQGMLGLLIALPIPYAWVYH